MSERGSLVILSETPRRVPLDEEALLRGFVIGRGLGVDLRLDDAHVSRRHCRLFLRDGQVHVENLSGSRGTLCNGVEVSEPTRLARGDVLGIGPHEIRVELTGSAGAAAEADVHQADTAREEQPADRPTSKFVRAFRGI